MSHVEWIFFGIHTKITSYLIYVEWTLHQSKIVLYFGMVLLFKINSNQPVQEVLILGYMWYDFHSYFRRSTSV